MSEQDDTLLEPSVNGAAPAAGMMQAPQAGVPGLSAGAPAAPGMNPQMSPQAQAGAAAAAYAAPQVAAPQVAMQQAVAQQAVAQPMVQPQADMVSPQIAEAVPMASVEDDLADVRPVPRVAIQAFCQTDHVASTINAASHDRRMSKAHVRVQMGGIAMAVEYYQTTATPNLIVLETQDDASVIVAELERLAEVCDEGTNVVVIGHRNDVQLYRQLISRGVAEYLVAPISMGDFMRVVSELFVNPEAEPLGQTIAFVGAKGGVGSSTVAHNVAFTISNEFESDVILTDFDLAFGTANIDFDKDPAQGVAEAVFSTDPLDDTFLDRLLAKCSDHLSLLAAPSTLDRDCDFGESDFLEIVECAQRGSPNVVIDLPHVWTGWSREVMTAADKVVIVATPDLASLRNTKNMMDKLTELRPNDAQPLLVLNQVGVPKRPEISADEFAKSLEVVPSAVIPFEPALFGQAANNGQMIAEAEPKHAVAGHLLTLSQIVTGRREIAPVKKSPLAFLSMFNRKSA